MVQINHQDQGVVKSIAYFSLEYYSITKARFGELETDNKYGQKLLLVLFTLKLVNNAEQLSFLR